MQRGLWEGDRAVRGCRFDDAAAIKVAAMAGDLIQQGVGVDDGRAAMLPRRPIFVHMAHPYWDKRWQWK